MSVVYDAGVLVAADRNDRSVWAAHRVRLELGIVPVTTAPVVAQVSRSPRQARLRQLLRGCHIAPFTSEQCHQVGALLGAAAASDVVDAHVIVTAAVSGSAVRTADGDDLSALSSHVRPPVRVLPV